MSYSKEIKIKRKENSYQEKQSCGPKSEMNIYLVPRSTCQEFPLMKEIKKLEVVCVRMIPSHTNIVKILNEIIFVKLKQMKEELSMFPVMD